MIELTRGAADDLLICIGARSGLKPTLEEARRILATSKNKRGDTILCRCELGFAWLHQQDVDWIIQNTTTSGLRVLKLSTLRRLALVRHTWSKKLTPTE